MRQLSREVMQQVDLTWIDGHLRATITAFAVVLLVLGVCACGGGQGEGTGSGQSSEPSRGDTTQGVNPALETAGTAKRAHRSSGPLMRRDSQGGRSRTEKQAESHTRLPVRVKEPIHLSQGEVKRTPLKGGFEGNRRRLTRVNQAAPDRKPPSP